MKLAPTNPLALARLARAIMAQNPDRNLRQDGEADRYIRQALRLGPNESEAWWARAEFFERAANLSEALEAIQRALKIQPRNPELWNVQGRMFEKTNRIEEAYQAFSKAIELARDKAGSTNQSQAKFYLSRANFLKKQNRLAEAGMDSCFARNIPLRDPNSGPDLIDLSPFYNAALNETWYNRASKSKGEDLSELPQGRKTFVGVEFDVRGVIQVSSLQLKQYEPDYPESVNGIRVERKCRRLHFLHSTGWMVEDGKQIGSYIVHYADGQQREIPIVYGKDVRDWDIRTDMQRDLERASTAWKGARRLLKSTWENPVPATRIMSIDYVSRMTDAAPFLIAITVEP